MKKSIFFLVFCAVVGGNFSAGASQNSVWEFLDSSLWPAIEKEALAKSDEPNDLPGLPQLAHLIALEAGKQPIPEKAWKLVYLRANTYRRDMFNWTAREGMRWVLARMLIMLRDHRHEQELMRSSMTEQTKRIEELEKQIHELRLKIDSTPTKPLAAK